jgi:prepilin-type N-terminal cleavage/methylation domain-containing protein
MSKMKVTENTYNHIHRVRRISGHAGFTLVETIVAMAIIAIVSVMLVSGMTAAMTMWNNDTDSRNQSAKTEADIAEVKTPTETNYTEVNIDGYALPTDINTYNDGRESHRVLGEGFFVPEGMELDGTPEFGNVGGTTGEYPVLQSGKYMIEVWGAAGGDNKLLPSIAGKGGYSVGTATLKKGDVLYLCAGGQGATVVSALSPGGANGGGTGANYGSYANGGGGGASDVRLNVDNYFSRIIVAGGGGGAASNHGYGNTVDKGGFGGGVTGGNGEYDPSWVGYGATISAGGATGADRGDTVNGPGVFGLGGSQLIASRTGAGGGGGWYGGGAGAWGGGGGGSGWVFTAASMSAWTNTTDKNSYTLKDYPEYYMTETQLVAGNAQMPDPRNNDTPITGNAGHGYVRISWVGLK